jgi:hypothetical protein
MSKIPVQVEVAVRASDQTADTLRQHVLVHLRENEAIFKLGSLVLPDENPLSSYIEAIEITELGTSNKRVEAVSFWQADLCVHIFTLSDEEPEAEILDAEGDDSEETSPCSQWTLPRRDFHGLWDSLILENGVKVRHSVIGGRGVIWLLKSVNGMRMKVTETRCLKGGGNLPY